MKTASGLPIIFTLLAATASAAQPGQLKWQLATGGSVISSPALGADGTLFIGSGDRRLRGIDGQTGAEKWSVDLGEAVTASPAVGSDGTVYIGVSDLKLVAVEGATGTIRWSQPLSGGYPVPPSSSPAIGPDGMVLIGTLSKALLAFGGAEGSRLWSCRTETAVVSSPGVAVAGWVFFGASDGSVYSCESGTGNLRWRYSGGGAGTVTGSPAFGPDGSVYAVVWRNYPDVAGRVVSLDGATGAMRWTWAVADPIQSSPAVGTNGTVYVGTDTHGLVALNGQTGTLLWSFKPGSAIRSTPAVLADNSICFGAANRRLYLVDAADGTPRWDFAAGGEIQSSPTVGPDGTIYFGCADGTINALQGSAGLAASIWPKFRGNARNDGSRLITSGPPVLVGQSGSGSRIEGTPLVLEAVAGGKAPLAYQWTLDGAPIPGATGTRLQVFAFGPTNAGAYRLRVTNDLGAGESAPMQWVLGHRVNFGTVGRGTVIVNPPPSDDGSLPRGSEVELTVRSEAGRAFSRWTGDAIGTNPAVRLTVDRPLKAFAWFTTVPGDLTWELAITNGSPRMPAVGTDGTIYVTTYPGATDIPALLALDGSTGELRWRMTGAKDEVQLVTRAALGDDRLGPGTPGRVVFAGLGGSLVAADSATGSTRWRVVQDGFYTDLAIGADDSIYTVFRKAGLGGCRLEAREGASGRLRWSAAPVPDGSGTTPVVGSDGSVYVAFSDGSIRAYEGGGGAMRWSRTGGGVVLPGLVLGDGDTVIAETGLALDPLTGALKWSARPGLPFLSFGSAVGAGGLSYWGGYSGTGAFGAGNSLVAVDAGSGASLWSVGLGATLSTPAIGADGVVYVSGSSGVGSYSRGRGLIAVDGASRKVLWELEARGPWAESPAIAPDGTVYLCSGSTISAVQGSAGLTAAPWPKEGGDAANRNSHQILTGPPVLVNYTRELSLSRGDSGFLAVIAGGMNLEYQWFQNEVPVRGAIGPRIDLGGMADAVAGNYRVRISNALGAVFSDPVPVRLLPRIDVRTVGPGTISLSPTGPRYEPGTEVTLTAVPNSGASGAFVGWSGDVTGRTNPLAVRMNGDLNVVARFAAAAGEELWRLEVPEGIDSTPALTPDGTLVTGTLDGRLLFVEAATGLVKRQVPLTGELRGSPAIGDDGTVHVGTGNGTVFAVDGESGAIRWTYAAGSAVGLSVALGRDGTVFVQDNDGRLHALDGRTGQRKWRFEGGNRQVLAAPVVGVDGTVYAVLMPRDINDPGRLHALDPATGEVRWTGFAGIAGGDAVAPGWDGRLYRVVGGTDTSAILSVDPAAGTQVWAAQSEVFPALARSPVLGPGGSTVLMAGGSTLLALNSERGTRRWLTTDFLAGFPAPPAVGADGTVYCPTGGNGLAAYDGITGKWRWGFLTTAWVNASPTLGPDGTLYFGTLRGSFTAGRLQAVQASSPLADSPWPKFRGDLRNTGRLSVAPGASPRLGVTAAGLAGVTLRIDGRPGQTLELQVSSDLTAWKTLQTLVNSTGTLTAADATPVAAGGRFYRLRVVGP